MLAPQKTGAEDCISIAPSYGLEQTDQLLGIVFQIRILHHYDISRGAGDTGSERRSLPAIARMMQCQIDSPCLSQAADGSASAVSGSVIYGHDLDVEGDRSDPLHYSVNRPLLVKGSNDDGKAD
jgi:hypothetical protein